MKTFLYVVLVLSAGLFTNARLGPVADGGPALVCDPSTGVCKKPGQFVITDGGPAPLCDPSTGVCKKPGQFADGTPLPPL